MKNILVLIWCILIPELINAQTFLSNVDQTIPDDGSTIVFDIEVSGLPMAIDTVFGLEEVCLYADHTWNSDLEISLRAPDGTTILLFSGAGGDGDGFWGTCLRMDVTNFISDGIAPFYGSYLPMDILGDINNGQDPNGTWQLIVHDTYAWVDQGYLYWWNITFGNNPGHPLSFESSNLPIVIIDSYGEDIPDQVKVPCHLKIIFNGPGQVNYTNQTTFAYEGEIYAEIQGFTGAWSPKKNYDFTLTDEWGNEIDTLILGLPKESDFILKAEYTDASLMKNPLAYEMARRMERYAPRTRFCEIILNGRYYGVYNLTEKVKRGANRVDIAKLTSNDISGEELTGGYIIEMNINGDPPDWTSTYLPSNYASSQLNVEFKHVYPKTGIIEPQQHDYIKSYVDSFENALAGQDFLDSLTGYRKYISVKSFIDFLIVNEFSANYDSYGRSTYLYKDKITDGGQLFIGPPWDYDRAFCCSSSPEGWVYEITHPGWPFPFWWMRFRDDPIYLNELCCRWMSLRQSVLTDNNFIAVVDSFQDFISEAAHRNFERWLCLGQINFEDQVYELKNYIIARNSWMDANLYNANLDLPYIYINDTVVCNGAVIDAFTGSQYEYNWVPGPDSSAITIEQSGYYTIKVKSEYGCYAMKEILVDVSVPDAAFNAVQNTMYDWNFSPDITSYQSYHWNFGDGSSVDAIYASHIFLTQGTHYITLSVTDEYGCENSHSQFIVVGSSGIMQPALSYDDVKVLRTDDEIILCFEANVNYQIITIYDVAGKVILRQDVCGQNVFTVSTKSISNGIYYYLVSGNKNNYTGKFIINKYNTYK